MYLIAQCIVLTLGRCTFHQEITQFAGSLEARSPQALSLDVQGDVLTTAPGSEQTVTVRASAAARGQLGGVDAVVAVSARLEPLALAHPPAPAVSPASHAGIDLGEHPAMA